MEEVTFLLKEPQTDIPKSQQKPTLVYMFFHFGYYKLKDNGKKKYIPLKYSTGMKILPYYWNDKPDYRAKQTKHFAHGNFNTRLDNIENSIIDIHRELLNRSVKPTPDILRNELNRVLGKGPQVQEVTLIGFIETIINDSKEGKRLTRDNKRIKPITIKGYRTTSNHLLNYQKDKAVLLDFNSINLEFYSEFTLYMHSKNYSTNTLGKHFKNLKVFMKEAYNRGLTKNTIFQNEKFRVVEEVTDHIYLNDDELRLIYDLDLSNNTSLWKVRDLFIVACYTGLRFSDLKQLKQKNFIDNDRFIELKTQKTGETVVIPLHWTINEILRKYSGELPTVISNQKMNKYLKDIGKLAELNQTISSSITKGGMRVDRNFKKYELITVHTARRSFATNMFINEVHPLRIMKITGHKTEKAFLKYIKISQEENAKLLEKHPYFKEKGSLRIV